jgi:hypothetical protein
MFGYWSLSAFLFSNNLCQIPIEKIMPDLKRSFGGTIFHRIKHFVTLIKLIQNELRPHKH